MIKFSNSFAFAFYIAVGLTNTTINGQSISDLQDLQKLRDQIESAQQGETTGDAGIGEIASDQLMLLEFEAAKQDSLEADDADEYFGYDFFLRSENLQIWDNLSPTHGYAIGPGDEIIISLWGQSELRSSHIVNRDGSIFIEKVGLLNLNGRTLEEVQRYIKNQFERIYATLKGPRAETFIDVSLGNLKTINITFLGEVQLPAIRPISPFSSVTTALIQAGGIKTTGSLRDIQVIRQDIVIAHFDLYKFLTTGNSVQDMQLLDRDVIFVPIRKSTIEIMGAVHRPAIYEANSGESIFAMIDYSGLTTPDASDKIELNRIIPSAMRTSEDNASENMYTTLAASKSLPARDGDVITVREILPQTNMVYIFGMVKFPGEYAYEEALSVGELLSMAGGIDDENYWQTVYKERADIIRRDPESDYPKVIAINLRLLKSGDESQNIALENWDQIIIRENPKYDSPKNVTVLGEVNIPGVYSIGKDGESLADLFERIGGFGAKAFEVGIKMYRENQRVILNDYTIAVQDGDSIFVPQRPGVVTVLGEVYTPGYIHHSKKLKLNDYIESAGGFNLQADRKNISVEYANGDVKINNFWGTPNINEGAIIRVHTKRVVEPFDTTEFLTELASIVASLATIAFMLRP